MLRVTFDATTVIEALQGVEPARGLLERARAGAFELAVPEVVFERLREPTRSQYLQRVAFAERIRPPSSSLGKAMLGRTSLGGYPHPAIHGNETVGGTTWRHTEDDAEALAAHESYGRALFVTRDRRLRREAEARGTACATPNELRQRLESAAR
jgi:rRNA-processing protein FCF1